MSLRARSRQRGETHQVTIQRSSIFRSSTPAECPRNTWRTSADTRLGGPKVPEIIAECPFFDLSVSPRETGVEIKSQTQTVQSLLPLTMNPRTVPSLSTSQSRSNLRHRTLPVCPSNVAIQVPVLMHQTLMVLSREPVMMREESKSRQ